MLTDLRAKSSADEDGRKKRVGKACDSCRMKKTKCDGRKPCSKCTLDNKLCTYSEKKKLVEKTYTSGYVELLECRIQILQNAVVKLVSKIAKDEDVSQYIPNNGEYSINNVIDLLMADEIDAGDDEAYHKLKDNHEDVVSSLSSAPSTAPSLEQGSSYSAFSQSEDEISSSPETSESPEISLNPVSDDQDDDALDKLDDLRLGPYKSAAAMAAAAAASMSGGYSMPMPDSPISMESPEMDAATNGWPFSTGISPAALDTTHSPSSPIQRQSSWSNLSKVHKSPRVQHRQHVIDTQDASSASIASMSSSTSQQQQQQQQQVRRSRSISANGGLRRHKRTGSSSLHHNAAAALNFDPSLVETVSPQQMAFTPVITAAPQQLMARPIGVPQGFFTEDSVMADDMWWNAKPMPAATTGPMFDDTGF